jgi:hypothetical protein
MSRKRARNLLEQIEWQRQQNQEQEDRRQRAQDNSGPQKPVLIPIVVVLPDEKIAFGWECPSSREGSLALSPLDSIDVKPQKECSYCSGDTGCDSCKNGNDTTSSSRDSPV